MMLYSIRVLLLMMMMMLFAITSVGCGAGGDPFISPAQDRDIHPLLEGLDPPPVNLPIEAERIPTEQVKANLPQGESSALLVLVDGQPFQGQLDIEGSIEVRAERIEVASARGRVEILYRLPAEMEREVPAIRKGSLRVTEFSAPAGADQSLRVEDDGRVLALGQSWTTSPQPLEIEIAQGIDIAQERAQSSEPGYTELRTTVTADGAETEAVVGKPFRVRAGEEEFEVFVEASHFFSPAEDDADQFPATYILHVWLVRVD